MSDREIKEGMIAKYINERDSYCADCFKHLDWDLHNGGDGIISQYWIAYCNCNRKQRMWTMRVDTIKLSSVNG